MGRGTGTYNPYTPDSGARPPALAGRGRELAHLRSIITQLSAGGTEQHVLITGLHGVGKTVLLNEFEGMCEEAGWPAEAKEVGRNSSIATLLGRAARRALLQMSAKKRAGERLRQALRVLKAFEVTLPGDVSFKLDVDAAVGHADSGDLAEDMRDVLAAVGQAAAEAGVGFALILDEIQNLDRDGYEALIMALHRSKQKNLPVSFVGAGLPLVPALTAAAKSYAERMFVYPAIGALAGADARDALILPARSQGVEWEEEALVRALAYTEGYPYFLQEYGRRAWAQGDGPRITAEDAETALALVVDDLDENFFEGRIGRLTDAEKLYVAAIADLGDGPQSSAAVARQLGRTPKSLSPSATRSSATPSSTRRVTASSTSPFPTAARSSAAATRSPRAADRTCRRGSRASLRAHRLGRCCDLRGCAPNARPCTEEGSSAQRIDPMGYHDAREIPNYWAYAQSFVLQDNMYEPNSAWSLARAPLPRLRVVGDVHELGRPAVVYEQRGRAADRGTEERRTQPLRRQIAAVDRRHLPAALPRRELGLLRLMDDRKRRGVSEDQVSIASGRRSCLAFGWRASRLGEAPLDPLPVGVVEGREVGGHDLRGLVDLLGRRGGVFVDEQSS